MKLKFIGTRGYIKPISKKHKMHTSLLIIHNKNKIMIDCGLSFLDRLNKIKPTHIIITHAHPDHAFGLEKGSKCPVYMTKNSWNLLKDFPIEQKHKRTIQINKKFKIGSITFEAFSVMHSIKAPAVGYRITCNRKIIFYVPDVLWITKRKQAFKNIKLYIGDGATIKNNLVRKDKKTGKIYGHANIRSQLTWCKKENVKKMIITHCGSDIVKKEKQAFKEIRELAKKREVDTEIAYDNMVIEI